MIGCGPGLVFNISDMTRDQMMARADHVFIGVIEKQEFEHWLFLNVPGAKRGDWTILKRQVRIETVLRGQESRQSVFLYEYFPATGGLTGNWNWTEEGERALFLVRVESGRYHLVRDFWRSIFPIYSGKHDRPPLDESHSLWERVGLLTWLPGEDHNFSSIIARADPGRALGAWRTARLARGFLRNPEPATRLFGCNALVLIYLWQDECVDQLFPEHPWPPDQPPVTEADAMREWGGAVFSNDIDKMRLLTTINHPALRREFCHRFAQRFPNDHDNGCPADRPLPATIVTQDGDVPLIGAWPPMRQ